MKWKEKELKRHCFFCSCECAQVVSDQFQYQFICGCTNYIEFARGVKHASTGYVEYVSVDGETLQKIITFPDCRIALNYVDNLYLGSKGTYVYILTTFTHKDEEYISTQTEILSPKLKMIKDISSIDPDDLRKWAHRVMLFQ